MRHKKTTFSISDSDPASLFDDLQLARERIVEAKDDVERAEAEREYNRLKTKLEKIEARWQLTKEARQ